MASRTQIVCLCEGEKGRSIDPVFINTLLKTLRPAWIRTHGSNVVRLVPCGGRKALIEKTAEELRTCVAAGGDTTLMVWADCDHDKDDGDALKADFWIEAERQGIARAQFDRIVFIFAKDRLENWIEFLQSGNTDESNEGPRVKHNRAVADAAKKLAAMCQAGSPVEGMPASLLWSCKNWQSLVKRMK
ncbi:MAG: hypothetical protein ACKVS9_11575 [Phycisphaerae bacterium]